MMQNKFEAITVLRAIDDRIDYLKAKYRDTQGEERMEWKSRFNESKVIREAILVAMDIDARKGDATDLTKENKNA
jgi:hypothetical protein